MYDTFGKHNKIRIIEVLSSNQYDKWRKLVVLLREYEKNISNTMSLNMYTMSLSNIDDMKQYITTPNKYKYTQELLK